MIRTLLLAGAVLAIGACADRNEYKVVDAHGWPVSTWDAEGADYIVLTCPARLAEIPRLAGEAIAPQQPGDAILVQGGVTRALVLSVAQRRDYESRYCFHPRDVGYAAVEQDRQPRTVRIAVQPTPRAATPQRAAEATAFDDTVNATGYASTTLVPTQMAAPGTMSRTSTAR